MKTIAKKDAYNIVGLKELRENTEHYISQVGKGASFIVVRRSTPIFTMTPPRIVDEGAWEEAVDLTKIKKGGIELSELLTRI